MTDTRAAIDARNILCDAIRHGCRVTLDDGGQWWLVCPPGSKDAHFYRKIQEHRAAFDVLLLPDDAEACFAVVRGLYSGPEAWEGKR